MADQYGIERSVLLPRIPLDAGFTPELLEYIRQLHESIYALYDELSRRQNELIFEQHWGSVTPAQVVADQNNYVLGDAVVHRFSTDASRTITGFRAPFIERMNILLNVGSFDLVIANQSVSSDAANRIITVTGANVTLASLDSMMIFYDLTSTRWRELVF